jgi:membrane protease YdiL (CAAX protease family)
MPGIDEEIAYRGILLGLLVKILKPVIRIGKIGLGHPAVLTTALLFGLAHGFFLTGSYGITFKAYPFFYTTLDGFIWGWFTLRSGSILLALISHNLTNTWSMLVRVMK